MKRLQNPELRKKERNMSGYSWKLFGWSCRMWCLKRAWNISGLGISKGGLTQGKHCKGRHQGVLMHVFRVPSPNPSSRLLPLCIGKKLQSTAGLENGNVLLIAEKGGVGGYFCTSRLRCSNVKILLTSSGS